MQVKHKQNVEMNTKPGDYLTDKDNALKYKMNEQLCATLNHLTLPTFIIFLSLYFPNVVSIKCNCIIVLYR